MISHIKDCKKILCLHDFRIKITTVQRLEFLPVQIQNNTSPL